MIAAPGGREGQHSACRSSYRHRPVTKHAINMANAQFQCREWSYHKGLETQVGPKVGLRWILNGMQVAESDSVCDSVPSRRRASLNFHVEYHVY